MITIAQKAVEKAGGVVALARGLGIKHHQTVYNWKKIPAEYVLQIETLTGIPCSELRPDLYPADRFPSIQHAEQGEAVFN